MTSETFTLSKCTIADIPGMINVYNNSFSTDYFSQYTFPRQAISDSDFNNWLTTRFTRTFTKSELHTFKITEESTGKIVAFSRWVFPHEFTEEDKAAKLKEKEERENVKQETGHDPNWPRGANLDACDAKFGGLDSFREKYVDEKETYVAGLLATDPAYQRKGLASRLLKHVLDRADSEGRKAYIEATAAGHPVYLKMGFKDVDILEVDLSKWGAKELGINRIMLRDPNPLS